MMIILAYGYALLTLKLLRVLRESKLTIKFNTNVTFTLFIKLFTLIYLKIMIEIYLNDKLSGKNENNFFLKDLKQFLRL